MLVTLMVFGSLCILPSCNPDQKKQADIEPNNVVPSPIQINYQQMEVVGFIHFTVNTFTNKEWGYGDENPSIFNPEQLNAEQWVWAAKEAGIKELILTAKHHDGFCLWPSKYTDHSIKSSPYKDGHGDVVAEFVAACRKHGLKVGLYLSPWDRNHKDYGSDAYITYYRNQLKELLTQYGEINEIWFDGANGGDGYYGGANEIRRIDSESYYNWPSIFALVKELQPNISIFSDAGPDIRWVGNESGYAGETFWSTINTDELVIGKSDTKYLNTGESHGQKWVIGQCDVSIRPGWFYHEEQDSLVKSPQDLVDIYYKSVGRNGVLLLNLPPNRDGLIHENDVNSLKAFKQIVDETFATNLATGGKCAANNFRLQDEKFSPQHIVDGDSQTYWATDELVFPAEITISLDEEKFFDRIMIQEPIRLGQRIVKFQIEVENHGDWDVIFQGTTIGYKRLIRTKPIHTSRVKLKITEANNTVAISNFALFKSSMMETEE